MDAHAVTLDNIDAALRANQQLQAELRQKCRRLYEAQVYLSALRIALCRPQYTTKARRRLAYKRDRTKASLSVYSQGSSKASALGISPFRDAGIYAEGGIPRYAQLPLTAEETRWREATLVFPQLQHGMRTVAARDDVEETPRAREWTKAEDEALVHAVCSYAGKPCGASFWKALAAPERSRFDVASRYIALQQRKGVRLVTLEDSVQPITDEEKLVAAQEAVRYHSGDLGAMFAAYVHYLATAARRHAYLAELCGSSTALFPPYVWESRIGFQRTVAPIIRQADMSAVSPEAPQWDELLLSQRCQQRAELRPSLVDLTACLLALKGAALGDKCGLPEITQAFLSNYGNIVVTLQDLTELKVGSD
ncbi:small nuclear RNA activating protein 2 [Trypanosoma grayi]|uniref:small nuclear RNA activating protein 2 n=1 Tax=Trypanosoma grayi TaxID=71804 RepID=UPI0004F407E8|nr:small nuclear RNA activating protein 2 [Trypanosoma grayi]KEG08976.1 small nuclear RNA activating protein 2 [Trypanosoma grayi]